MCVCVTNFCVDNQQVCGIAQYTCLSLHTRAAASHLFLGCLLNSQSCLWARYVVLTCKDVCLVRRRLRGTARHCNSRHESLRNAHESTLLCCFQRGSQIICAICSCAKLQGTGRKNYKGLQETARPACYPRERTSVSTTRILDRHHTDASKCVFPWT